MATSYNSRLGSSPEEAIKAPCVAATVDNVILSGLQIIGTVQLTGGDRVLVTNQTDPTENGVYAANNGAWNRSTDWNEAEDLISGMLIVAGGLVYQASYTGQFSIDSTAVTINQWKSTPNRVVLGISRGSLTASASMLSQVPMSFPWDVVRSSSSTTSWNSLTSEYTPEGTGAYRIHVHLFLNAGTGAGGSVTLEIFDTTDGLVVNDTVWQRTTSDFAGVDLVLVPELTAGAVYQFHVRSSVTMPIEVFTPSRFFMTIEQLH